MSKYVKEISVLECYFVCPFFSLEGNLMVCKHPYFEDEVTSNYENLIITKDNSRGRIPDKCPLKNGDKVEICMRVKLGSGMTTKMF